MSINNIDTEHREGLQEGLANDMALHAIGSDPGYLLNLIDGGTKGTVSKSDYDLVKENLIFCPWGSASPYDIAVYLRLDKNDAKLLSKDEDIRDNWNSALYEEIHYHRTSPFPTDPEEQWEKMMRLQFGLP